MTHPKEDVEASKNFNETFCDSRFTSENAFLAGAKHGREQERKRILGLLRGNEYNSETGESVIADWLEVKLKENK